MGRIRSRPNWSTGEAAAIRPSIFWKALSRRLAPSLKEGRVELNRRGSLRWDSCSHLHWVDNCAQEQYSLAGLQYALGKFDPEPQATRVYLLSFWKLENICVLFCLLSQRLDARALKWARWEPITQFPLHPALSGLTRGTLETAYGVVWQQRDSGPSSFCLAFQEDFWGAGSKAILGRGSWRFWKG